MTDDVPTTGPEARVLRPFAADDARIVARLASDSRVTRYVGSGATWSPEYTSRRVAEALAAVPGGNPAAVRWFIGLEDGRRVGLVVSLRRGPTVEIGYWVCPGNQASIRVLESQGFQSEPGEGPDLRFVLPAAVSGS